MNDKNNLLNLALALSIITVLYNIAEGLVSIFFGYQDETLALFGFGIDSFVEVISGAGVGHMIWRMKRNPVASRDRFEKQALRITGIGFYLLTVGLVAGSVFNIIFRNKPDTTIAGIIISAISILTMWILYKIKLSTGRKLDSEAIISDANCTKTCFYLSFILLASSVLYELFGISYIDIIGGCGIAFFAFREGKEALEKAKSGNVTCSCEDD
jgi:divalent metal cation (Fe/Co/Zn/Cd) transporter